MAGKPVFDQQSINGAFQILNISKLAPAIYVISYRDDGTLSPEKFMKE